MKAEHFEPGLWTDFARGLVPESERKPMQVHLNDGCESCLRTQTDALTRP